MYLLNEKEKACLKTIARRTRIDYLEKNKYTYLEDDIDIAGDVFISNENIEIDYEEKVDRNLKLNEIEKVFRDPKKIKSLRILSLKEKAILYLYFWEEKTDKEIAKVLNIKANTIAQIRKRAIRKVREKYYQLDERNGKYNV